MKLAVRLLIALSLLTLFAIGVDMLIDVTELSTMVFGPRANWPGLRGLETPWLSFGIAMAAFLLPVLAGAAWTLWGRDDSIKAASNDGDLIRLSPQAIERTVNREVRANVVEVSRVSTTAWQGTAEGPGLEVRIAVSDKRDVPSVERDVREETVRVLKHLLGIADTSKIRIVVYDVQGARVRSRRNGKKPAGNGKKTRRERPKPKALDSQKSEDTGPNQPAGKLE